MKILAHDFHNRDDDLLHCKVCNGAEGSLTKDCPGVKMTQEQEDGVMAGTLDFFHGRWWGPVGHVPQGTGACIEPAPNTINIQAYDAEGKLAGCSTRSSSNLSEDMHVMGAAWEFNGAAKRGVEIHGHRVENLLISTVVAGKEPNIDIGSLTEQAGAWISVVDALHRAYPEGFSDLGTTGESSAVAAIDKLAASVASASTVNDAVAEHYEAQQTSMVRATVAAVMEAAALDTLTIGIEKQATIWDRVEMFTDRNEDQTHVTFTLTPR